MSFLASTAQRTIVNDPNVALRSDIKGFHGIHVTNAIDLYLSQSDEEVVAVSAADPKWRDRIRTEVIGGILHIYLDNRGFIWNGGKKMRAYISFTHLDVLNASGASDVYVDGVISGDNLEIKLTGASDFKGAIKVGSLKLDASGASDAQITGSVAGMTTIQAHGASDLKGYDLVTDNCDAHVSGASDVRITVNKELNAHASGASSIYYKGEAVIRDLHSSGASSVNKKKS